jgi:hypothetical protein
MEIIFNENNDVVLIQNNKKTTFVRYSEPIVEKLVDLNREINYNNNAKEK